MLVPAIGVGKLGRFGSGFQLLVTGDVGLGGAIALA